MNRSRHALASILFLVVVTMSPAFARAIESSPDVLVTPVVVDKKAKVRDILKETITIKNTSNRKLNLFPAVNDVHSEDGEQQFVAAQNGLDRAESLANWIELPRGVVELNPGEEKVIPFVIRVNLNGVAGTYHAQISFYEGSIRDEAEKSRPLASVIVNTEVSADIKEAMQLGKFFTDNIFFSGDDVLFNLQLENIGNQELQPKGEIRIYDRRGTEVASIDVNTDGKSVSPDQMAQLASVWNAAEGFGKFKAFLNVDYGNSQNGSLQDTVYFWIIPWQQLLGLIVISVFSVIGLSLYVHTWLERRHNGISHIDQGLLTPALAHAGGIPQHMTTDNSGVPKLSRVQKFVEQFRRVRKGEYPEVGIRIPAREAAGIPLAAPAKLESAVASVTAPAPVALDHVPPSPRADRAASPGGAIDLKDMNSAVIGQQTASSIINLKDMS